MLQITNQLLTEAARQRGWRVEIINESLGVIRYTDKKGKRQLVKSSLTEHTSALHLIVAENKKLFNQLAQEWKVPIPKTELYKTWPGAVRFWRRYSRIVVKPQNSAHGQGVTTHVTNQTILKRSIASARAFSDEVLLQQYIKGDDYRLLFIGGRFLAAAIRQPASVTGDGRHTVKQLIDRENNNPIRGPNYTKPLNLIDHSVAKDFLGKRLNVIPARGRVIPVVGTTNIGTGGYAIDATDSVPKDLLRYAQVIVDKLGIPVCGVDFINSPERGPFALEINTSPSLGLHALPFTGKSRPVADQFLDWLSKAPTKK